MTVSLDWCSLRDDCIPLENGLRWAKRHIHQWKFVRPIIRRSPCMIALHLRDGVYEVIPAIAPALSAAGHLAGYSTASMASPGSRTKWPMRWTRQ